MARVSLAQVAAAVDLSVSGVCRALQNDSRIPAVTRARVKRVAARLGYRPDPKVSEAFRRVGQVKSRGITETIAYLTTHPAPIFESGTDYMRALFRSASAQAEMAGFRMEEFWLKSPGMSLKRTVEILKARGVRGCVFAPAPTDISGLRFPWDIFATVALTYTLAEPQLHRAIPFNYQHVRVATERAIALGYRRIGLLLDSKVNRRTLQSIHAGYLVESAMRPEGVHFAPVLEFTSLDDLNGVHSWYRRNRLDLIISSHSEVMTRLGWTPESIPFGMGFIALGNGRVDPSVSSIDQQPEEVGKAGWDLLRAMLDAGETGVPKSPRTLLIPGRWVPAKTTSAGRSTLSSR